MSKSDFAVKSTSLGWPEGLKAAIPVQVIVPVVATIGALLVAFSFALLLVVKWLRFDWTSGSRFAPSTSQ